ncbi:MAG: hypothetical protein P8173_12670 [Gammaproteobacteria bacterium]
MEKSKGQTRIELVDFGEGDATEELAVYALDRAENILEMSPVDPKGYFKLPPEVLAKASHVLIGPKIERLQGSDKEIFARFRVTQFTKVLEARSVIEIAKSDWYKWWKIRRCVSGNVKHCYPWPILIKQYIDQIAWSVPLQSIGKAVSSSLAKSMADAVIAKPPISSKWPPHCGIVCDGLVEVYRRTCCCRPWTIYDPRLQELIGQLEKYLTYPPIRKWPPHPDPDPGPLMSILFKSGTLDERVANAAADLHALKSLPAEEIPQYINVRPWLCCTCGSSKKVAQGLVRSDGKFTICWYEWPLWGLINCHEEYAFVVKQNINGVSTVIYNGVAAHQWFHYGDYPTLVSHHLQAQGCRQNPFPNEEGAFVLLQDIGLTGTFHLKTPDAAGWDRVAAPAYNDGLAYPAADTSAAKGKYLDRNWGGTLLLRCHFSEHMKAVGAKYYRISVVASDGNGNPMGDRTHLPVSQWRYYELIGPDIYVKQTALGPDNAGTQNNLYEIPYYADHDWQSGQYHAVLDTTKYANGRFLLTVEVFDKDGKLLHPAGTAAPSGIAHAEAGYTFRRWYQETGPTAEVHFAALTHMLWWDNRSARAEIVDLRKDGVPSTAECQFITGTASSLFSVGYRAYHDEPMFLLDHRLWWHRGLGTATGILTSPHPNPDNVGVPPNPPHESGQTSFANMLDTTNNPTRTKCSFTVNLHANVKTFNGIGTLDSLDGWDQAAFALDISGLCIPLSALKGETLNTLQVPVLEYLLARK